MASLVRSVEIRYLLFQERMATGVAYNPLSLGMRANPYPAYHRLRARDPVHWSWLASSWVLTRYADVVSVLRDPHFSADRTKSVNFQEWVARQDPPPKPPSGRSMLFVDPPDHTRLRTLVNKAFTPRAVEAMRPRIEEIVDGLLDAVQDAGQMDVIRDLGYPLPVIVIAELLGIPPKDRAQFKEWSDALAATIEFYIPPEAQRRAEQARGELVDYLGGVFRERRTHPRQDLVSALVAAEEQGDRLSEDELFATCALLLIAGNETSTNLIGNGVLALLRHPDQLSRLHEGPALIESAVEELLRHDSPVQVTSRVATEDKEISGKKIRKGQGVIVLLGAANRDPQQFADPDRLDIDRAEKRHVAFGYGSHFCLGAPLARIEAQFAIRAVLRRMPNLRLATDTPRWRQTMVLRGLESLPVTF